MLEATGGCVRVLIRAQPRASRTEIVGEHNGALKVRIAAPPVEGAANAELVKFIAKKLGIASSRIRVLAGESARTKVVAIDHVDLATVRRVLLG